MADAGVVEVSGGNDGQSGNFPGLDVSLERAAEISTGGSERLGGFDEEAPLAAPTESPDSNKSPPPEPVHYLSKAHPTLLPYDEEEFEGLSSSAKPLIILPVQSQGVPTSGAFPLGRTNPTSPAAMPQGEELKHILLQQLEYYFSKDNLSSDKYLLSQMDGDNYVPLSVISNFNQVKKLPVDMALILEVLRESTVLQLDETEEKVRAIPEKRCVLILREIPKDTPKEDIESLFSHDPCPPCVTCEFADNNCWYVTFDSEESTQKAFAYLREEVRVFLGQPIRARIKGTTVQRSSGMPKTKHVPFNVPPVYNGAPSQIPYYPPPPPSGVMPWSPTPPTSSSTSPYFETFTPYNGFTPPQQGAPNQVGSTTGQSPAPAAAAAGTGQSGLVPGGRYPPGAGFPYMPMVRGGEGDRGGRGRMGPANRSHRGGINGGSERPQSPPFSGDAEPGQGNSEREKSVDNKSGRGIREHGGSTGGPGGGVPGSGGGVAGTGGRFGRHVTDGAKMPRLKPARYREGERGPGNEKTSQVPPRQQPKVQPKLDLATAHFPPLPNSSSSDNGTTPSSAPPITSHGHTSTEDGPKTLSDIVRGGGRAQAKEAGGPTPNSVPSPAAVASNVVEKSIASASAKVSQTPSLPNSHGSQSPPDSGSQPTTNSDPSPQASRPDSQQQKLGVASGSDVSSGRGVSTTVTTVTSSRPITASSVVSSGGGGGGFTTVGGSGNRAPPPPPAPAFSKSQKTDTKVSGKDKFYSNGNNGNNKAYNRYSDRDYPSSKQNRNTQVLKSDNRSAASANRSRHKDRDLSLPPSRGGTNSGGNARPGNGTRVNNAKSPKSFKKNFPHHASQAPPPPPGPDSTSSDGGSQTVTSAGTKTGTKTENVTSSSSSSSSSAASSQSQSAVSTAKPEKLSYAQMAQKKNHQNSAKSSAQDPANSSEGGGKPTSLPTSPQTTEDSAAPPQSAQSIKSTSTGSLAVGQGQSLGTITSKSAPTSPTKESGVSAATDGSQSKEGEVPV